MISVDNKDSRKMIDNINKKSKKFNISKTPSLILFKDGMLKYEGKNVDNILLKMFGSPDSSEENKSQRGGEHHIENGKGECEGDSCPIRPRETPLPIGKREAKLKTKGNGGVVMKLVDQDDASSTNDNGDFSKAGNNRPIIENIDRRTSTNVGHLEIKEAEGHEHMARSSKIDIPEKQKSGGRSILQIAAEMKTGRDTEEDLLKNRKA